METPVLRAQRLYLDVGVALEHGQVRWKFRVLLQCIELSAAVVVPSMKMQRLKRGVVVVEA